MSSEPKALRSSINGWNAQYLEAQHEAYLKDPNAVPPDVRAFFQGYELAQTKPGAGDGGGGGAISPTTCNSAPEDLALAYRGRGHLAAKLDPFDRPRERPAALTLEQFGLTEADLDNPVPGSIIGRPGMVPLREVVSRLEMLYTGTVGVEVLHVEDY